jgi:hypothetical protein
MSRGLDKSFYWKITKNTGFKASLVHLKFPEDRINGIMNRLNSSWNDDTAEKINRQGFFFVSICEAHGRKKYEWNDYEFPGWEYDYQGEVVLRKQKLEKLKEISNEIK